MGRRRPVAREQRARPIVVKLRVEYGRIKIRRVRVKRKIGKTKRQGERQYDDWRRQAPPSRVRLVCIQGNILNGCIDDYKDRELAPHFL